MLNVKKQELFKDLEKAVEFDQSSLFKKIYEEEYGQLGGQPYGMLVGDYEFGRNAEDINLLKMISGVAAAAHAPFVVGRQPQAVRLRQLHRAGQAARPGQDLRRRRVRRLEVVPRVGRFALRGPDHAAASWAGCPTARTSSGSTSSTSRRRSTARTTTSTSG